MENNRSDELYHYGRKGMKWYQNIYTSAKNARTNRKRKKSLEKAREVKKQKAIEAETDAQKKARLLNSTDPNELYENRKLLTTAEINERINRIDTEARLASIAAKTKTTGRDRVDKIMKYAGMANDLYEVTQKPVVKALKKQIMGEKEVKKITNLDDAFKNIDKLSDDELSKALKRAKETNAFKDLLDPDRKNAKSSGMNKSEVEDMLRDMLEEELEKRKNK